MIGIDLISLVRVKRFMKGNKVSRLKTLLSPQELKSSSRLSAANLAKMFAAKEAFFKAADLPWMGLEGFAGIEVKYLPQGRFRVKFTNSQHASGSEGTGCFFRTGNLVGAQVILHHAVAAS